MVQRFWLLLMLLGLTAFAEAQGIAAAAASPYELAKFVETHHDFEWGPLWKALNISNASIFLPSCEEDFDGVAPCSSELIAVDPLQMILVLEHNQSSFQVFLRYESTGAGVWQFVGAYAPHVKYFRPEHHITRFGAKPFIVVSEQGISGSGLSSKVDSWIDLTQKGLDPVFSFTSEGHETPDQNGGVGRETRAFVISLENQPVERIAVAFNIEFTSKDLVGEIPIGNRMDRVVYVKTATGTFEPDQSLSTATAREIEIFYNNFDPGFSREEFLKFHLKGPQAIAVGKDNETRSWLSDFLMNGPDTLESRHLKTLIGAPR